MANSFDLSVNVRNANPSANIDHYYGTYESVAAACAGVPKAVRLKGKTVGIIIDGSVVEYWWRSGIEDSDLVVKFGVNTTTEEEYVEEVTDIEEGSTGVLITKAEHKKGDTPLVQCYLNGSLILLDISNDGGDITVSWEDITSLTPSDVLDIVIVSSDYAEEFGADDPLVVSLATAECGENPMVQCFWDGGLVLVDVVRVGNDLHINASEEVEITDLKPLTVVLCKNTFAAEFANPNEGHSCTISKTTHGKGDKPLVQCWVDNKVVLLDIENSGGDITISWENSEDVSALSVLRIVVGNGEASSQTRSLDDLAEIAWSGSYDDLKDRPVYAVRFVNAAGGTSVTLPASRHKCGANVMVQCRVGGYVAQIDTDVDANGNITVSWGVAELISSQTPLDISVVGLRTPTHDFNEEIVVDKSTITVTMLDESSRDEVGELVGRFDVGSRLTLESFSGWVAYSDKYEVGSWFANVGEEDAEYTVLLSGKEYELSYRLLVTWTASQRTEVVDEVYETVRYGTTVSLSGVTYHDEDTGVDHSVEEWQNPDNIGTLTGDLYIMNGAYASAVTLVGVVNIVEE